jgi:hypothetical protein
LGVAGRLCGRGSKSGQHGLKTVQRLTGLGNIYLEQVYTFGTIDRVPTERVITTCYYALIQVEPTLEQLSPKYEATWHPISFFFFNYVIDGMVIFQDIAVSDRDVQGTT